MSDSILKAAFFQCLASLGFKTYQEYLDSSHWQAFRASYRESDLPQSCQCCGAKKTQLHHLTYKRLGCELLADVTPLCGPCHYKVHGKQTAYHLALNDIQEAIRAVKRGDAFLPNVRNHLTKQNSTKRQRKVFNRRCRHAKGIIQQSRHGEPGQLLVHCPQCGRRAWQDGVFCVKCGIVGKTIKQN